MASFAAAQLRTEPDVHPKSTECERVDTFKTEETQVMTGHGAWFTRGTHCHMVSLRSAIVRIEIKGWALIWVTQSHVRWEENEKGIDNKLARFTDGAKAKVSYSINCPLGGVSYSFLQGSWDRPLLQIGVSRGWGAPSCGMGAVMTTSAQGLVRLSHPD